MAPQSMKKVRRKDAWHTPIEKDIGENPQNMLDIVQTLGTA